MKLPIAAVLVFLVWLFTGGQADVPVPSSQSLRKLYGDPTMERFVILAA